MNNNGDDEFDFDDIPDEFADIEGVDWAQLLAGHAHPTLPRTDDAIANNTRHLVPPPPPPPGSDPDSVAAGATDITISSSNSSADANAGRTGTRDGDGDTSISSNYFGEDDMDSEFLAELDQVEQRAIIRASQVPADTTINGYASNWSLNTTGLPRVSPSASTSNHGASSHVQQHSGGVTTSFLPAPQPQISDPNEGRGSPYFTAGDVKQPFTAISKKRPRSASPEQMSPKRKGKMRAENDIDQILSTYEDELTCPICCDLFVASHVGNPCGHTFCGECGWEWHVKNRNKACPCCRLNFNTSTPMIPNISMDNTVDKHVKALALSGSPEWQQGGKKLNDWMARKQAWKDGAAHRKMTTRRAPGAKPPRVQTYHINQLGNVLEGWPPHQLDDEEEDPTYEDSDIELIPRRIIPRIRRGRAR